LLDQYVAWNKDESVLREVNGWTEITTPYLDRHNDYLQIYARREDNNFVLTDDGCVIEDLQQSGCTLDSKKRRQLLETTLNGFGVRLDSDALGPRTSASNSAVHKHNLVQAMLAVNDLFYLAAPTVASLFLEDIALWLDRNEVRYIPKIKLTGESGYDHLFDFVIPKSRVKPERILKAINNPNRTNAEAVTFAWLDTRKVRPPESQAYVFLNDSERAPSGSVIEALQQYELRPVPGSERDNVKQELAA
jgi:hypothetical protein